MERTEKLRDLAVLIVIAGIVLLWNLGTGSLSSWDESVYAQVSREMLNSHNYIDLTWAGERWNDKPPLYMWMTVIFYKIFGVGEFAARLFSAICGIGTIVVTYLLASTLYSRRIALAAGLILISTSHFVWASKIGMLDMALTFFISLSLYWFIIGMKKQIYLFFSMLAFGCAFLTKGFGALLTPIIILIYILYTREFKVLLKPALWGGLLIALLVMGCWHFLAFIHYGKNFVNDYIVKHLFTRVGQAVEGHTGTVFTYLKVISNKGRPWSIAVFFIMPFVLWEVFKKGKKSGNVLPLAWAFTTIILFSLVKTKLNWYILPVYPAIAMLIGWGIDRLLNRKTLVFVSICAIASLVYLTFGRGIFNLDYTHETKKLALFYSEKLSDKGKIFIFDNDPAVRFYFLDKGINAHGSLSISDLLKEKNSYVVLSKKMFSTMDKSRFSAIQESPEFVIIKIN